MTNIFYDTEFLEDGNSIKLISIGMVTDKDEEYYSVNADLPLGRIGKHPWLMENVVPHLPVSRWSKDSTILQLDWTSPVIRYPEQIANEVRDFITSQEDPDLWAYFGAFDHVVLAWLWGPMVDMPRGIPMYTNDIRQEMFRLGIYRDHLPREVDYNSAEHNALSDAKWNKRVYEWLKEYELQH